MVKTCLALEKSFRGLQYSSLLTERSDPAYRKILHSKHRVLETIVISFSKETLQNQRNFTKTWFKCTAFN